mmetsp:Transcript_10980/g.13784  ORF Transcript_10980/g.13784 Transcript_10980/m.13784 type:complete len:1061 (+) Transcript_10980:149-3331(+)
MALYGTVDSIVHVHRFTNIDLTSRGIYYIRISIADAEDKKTLLKPSNFFSFPRSRHSYVKKVQVPSVIPASELGECHTQEHFFGTRMFSVRYRNETMELNEACHFKFEKKAKCKGDQISMAAALRVRFELMRSDIEPDTLTVSRSSRGLSYPSPDSTDRKGNNTERANGRPQKDNSGSSAGDDPQELRLETFKSLAMHEVILRQLDFGTVHEYVPITFDYMHFVKLDVVLHLSVTNLRFDGSPQASLPAIPGHKNTNGSDMNDSRQSEGHASTLSSSASRRGKSFRNRTKPFVDFVFPGAEYDKFEAKDAKLDAMYKTDDQIAKYNAYLRPMVESLEAITTSLHIIHDEYLNEDVQMTPEAKRWKKEKIFARKPPGCNLEAAISSVAATQKHMKSIGANPLDSAEFLSKAISGGFSLDETEEAPESPSPSSFISKALSGMALDPLRSRSPSAKKVLKSGTNVSVDSLGGEDNEDDTFISNFKRWKLSNLFVKKASSWTERASAPQVKIAAESIQRDINTLNDHCQRGWESLTQMLPGSASQMCKGLTKRWIARQQQQWEHALFFRSRSVQELDQPDGCNLPDLEDLLAYRRLGAKRLLLHAVQDLMIFGEALDDLCCTMELYYDEKKMQEKEEDSEIKMDLGSDVEPTEDSGRALQLSIRSTGSYESSASAGQHTRDFVLFHALAECMKKKTEEDEEEGQRGQYLWQEEEEDPSGSSLTGLWSLTTSTESFKWGMDVVVSSEDTYLPAWQGNPLRPPSTPKLDILPPVSPVAAPVAAGSNRDIKEGPHVFVLQHGLHGNNFDMNLIANHIMLIFPDAIILNSSVNSDESDNDLDTMGGLLAEDVRRFIVHNCPEMLTTFGEGRLSFVAHSAGGVIVRACLARPEMKILYKRFYTIVTLSSPHLGNLYPTSHLVQTGMHVLNLVSPRMNKPPGLLTQLLMNDARDKRKSFLYELSEKDVFSSFQHVVFVTAHDDQYVPKHSALVQMAPDTDENSDLGKMYSSMIENILSDINPEKLLRINVFTNFSEKNVDTFIGRAAHISYLDSPRILSLLFCTLYEKLK